MHRAFPKISVLLLVALNSTLASEYSPPSPSASEYSPPSPSTSEYSPPPSPPLPGSPSPSSPDSSSDGDLENWEYGLVAGSVSLMLILVAYALVACIQRRNRGGGASSAVGPTGGAVGPTGGAATQPAVNTGAQKSLSVLPSSQELQAGNLGCQPEGGTKKFPQAWGCPKDASILKKGSKNVTLPGGYGVGKQELAAWIQTKLDQQSKQQKIQPLLGRNTPAATNLMLKSVSNNVRQSV